MGIWRILVLALALLHGASAGAQAITTYAGSGTSGYNGDDPTRTAATANLFFPAGIAIDAGGNLYIADSSNHRVRKVTPAGVITTVAGDGTPGSGNANLAVPTAVALDAAGNLFVADTFNHRIQRVEAGTGTVTTVAGTGSQGTGADGVAATTSPLSYPRGIAVDAAGNLFIADTENHRVRVVAVGIISTVAGTGTPTCSASTLFSPRGLALAPGGDLYIADWGNARVMRLSGGTLGAFAGPDTGCVSGTDDGAAASARFGNVAAVALAGADLLVADAGNSRVRRVSAGTVTTVAGTSAGYGGDGGAAASAQMNSPRGIVAGPTGSDSFYVSDFSNHRVRKVARIAPAAPTLDTATPGNTQAVLAFTPGYDGGSAVTSFTASCMPGPVTQAGAASPLAVTGLANDTQYTCSVTATNAIGTSEASNTLTVTPGIPPAITSAAPPGGTVGVVYSHTYTATGTPAPTFAVSAGALPGGLALSPAGVLTGAPSAAGTFTGTVTASNGVAPAADQAFSITITLAAQAIAFPALPDRTLGTGPFTLAATGGASGNPVVFASTTPAVCTATGTNGTTLTLAAAGTCTITANQAGNASYAAAPQAQRSFAVVIVPTTLSLSGDAIDFGGQSMGTTSPAIGITVTNTGSAPLLVGSVTPGDPQFAATHNCANVPAAGTCTIQVTFSPAVAAGPLNSTVAVAGSLAIASTATGSPHVAALAGVAEKSLVSHYYRAILRRAPDAGGKAFWTGEAQRVASLGANTNEAWFAMAISFYSSAEYVAFDRDPTDFVTDLYNTFFNRAPDAGGRDFWVGQIAGGLPRDVVLLSFLFSSEFATFTTAIFGNAAVRPELDAVMDFYRGLLARLPDDGGFGFWVGRFRAAQCQGAAAVAAEAESISSLFALSPEYAGRNRTATQYVGDLYNAFLRRGADLAGVQFWIGQVESGAQTREQVRQAFLASAEFGGRVDAIINAGCLPP